MYKSVIFFCIVVCFWFIINKSDFAGGAFMERIIMQKLINWKNSKYRKPLILKGVCVK
jgi:hypothetical protein